MASPNSLSIWPKPPETLAEQVSQSVLAAMNDSADALTQTMQTLTSSPSTPGVEAFFASINPLLTANLADLQRYTLRTVFSIPPNSDPVAIAAAVKTAETSNTDTTSLDHEIATLRARIRQCDHVIARLTAARKTAEDDATVLRAVAPESVTPHQFETLCADVSAAEDDFAHATTILKEHRRNVPFIDPLLQAAAHVVAKPARLPDSFNVADENTPSLWPCEEHEPLNHMPSAQGILGISMGADTDRLHDLAILRARLLG